MPRGVTFGISCITAKNSQPGAMLQSCLFWLPHRMQFAAHQNIEFPVFGCPQWLCCSCSRCHFQSTVHHLSEKHYYWIFMCTGWGLGGSIWTAGRCHQPSNFDIKRTTLEKRDHESSCFCMPVSLGWPWDEEQIGKQWPKNFIGEWWLSWRWFQALTAASGI